MITHRCCTMSLLQSRMHKCSTFRRTKSKNFSGATESTLTGEGEIQLPSAPSVPFDSSTFGTQTAPSLHNFNKFTPMDSCDVFLYSVARPTFILAFTYLLFHLGPTNKGVHKGPQDLATPLYCTLVYCIFLATCSTLIIS